MNAASAVPARLAAQTALAELFLDTALDDGDIARLAARLCDTNLPLADLEHILRREVAPALTGNLISTGGEWQAWSPEEMAAILARRPPLFGMLGPLGSRMVRADWMRIRSELMKWR